jgi:hypothetical protein
VDEYLIVYIDDGGDLRHEFVADYDAARAWLVENEVKAKVIHFTGTERESTRYHTTNRIARVRRTGPTSFI